VSDHRFHRENRGGPCVVKANQTLLWILEKHINSFVGADRRGELPIGMNFVARDGVVFRFDPLTLVVRTCRP